MVDYKRVLIANSYLLGTIIIIASFIWMFGLAIAEADFEQVMIAFFVCISGIVFWGIANHYNAKNKKLKLDIKMQQNITNLENGVYNK